MFSTGGRALNGLGGLMLTDPNQTPNASIPSITVGLREMSFVAERETAQIIG